MLQADAIMYLSTMTYGVMMPQTPTGCLIVMTVALGIDDGIESPYALGASSANQRMKEAAYFTSPVASARVLPFSCVKMIATGTG